jgi:hypothetical protein
MMFFLTADFRRQYFFPGRPGQGKPACPSGKQVLHKIQDLNLMNFSLGGLNKVKLFINREAIDVFFVPRVAGQKGLRKSRG